MTHSSSSSTSGIVSNDQGYFQNKPSQNITQIPSLNLAYLSNVKDNLVPSDDTIALNPCCINWCDFTNLFFRSPGGAFYINPSNGDSKPISFYSQTYETTQNANVKFSLADQIRKTWSKKNNQSEISIPIPYYIMLNRSGFLTKSLAYVNGTVLGLSLDEVISALLTNNEIAPADSESSADVKFLITYKDYFEPLDTSVSVIFTFCTKIPCYKNINDCENFCPYSNDLNCERKVFEMGDDFSDVFSCNEDNCNQCQKKSENDDNTLISNDDCETASKLNELLNDTNTLVTNKSW